jgi:hypothetical protein
MGSTIDGWSIAGDPQCLPTTTATEKLSATPTPAPAATAKPRSTLTDEFVDYARIADVYILDAAMNSPQVLFLYGDDSVDDQHNEHLQWSCTSSLRRTTKIGPSRNEPTHRWTDETTDLVRSERRIRNQA